MPPSSPNMQFRKCTLNSNTASPVPFTERLYGTDPLLKLDDFKQLNMIYFFSVRSREGRRNRAPPPRVRFNKDGKKINPQQAAKVAQA